DPQPVPSADWSTGDAGYKPVAKRTIPVSGTMPPGISVKRTMPEDPLITLPHITANPPEFEPTAKLTRECMDSIKINESGFLWPEEVKLFQHILKLNEATLAFEESDRGTLKESYFSPYIYPLILHTPWEYKNIPIPPGIASKVAELLRSKIEAGVYEP
ncbi:hypothetical protein FISHEDRAFT_9230, partial [Fistulina hepatica ATCC 64428]